MEAIWPLDLFVNVGIQIWALDQHGCDLGRQITLERGGRFFAKNSQKNRRYIADFLAIFCKKSPGRLISSMCRFATRRHAIYWRYFADFFRFFPPCLRLLSLPLEKPCCLVTPCSDGSLKAGFVTMEALLSKTNRYANMGKEMGVVESRQKMSQVEHT